MDKTLAQIAYEAYAEHTGRKTWDGKPMPTWEQVEVSNTKVAGAWAAAAEAVQSPALCQQLLVGVSAQLLASVLPHTLQRIAVKSQIGMDTDRELTDEIVGVVKVAKALIAAVNR